MYSLNFKLDDKSIFTKKIVSIDNMCQSFLCACGFTVPEMFFLRKISKIQLYSHKGLQLAK